MRFCYKDKVFGFSSLMGMPKFIKISHLVNFYGIYGIKCLFILKDSRLLLIYDETYFLNSAQVVNILTGVKNVGTRHNNRNKWSNHIMYSMIKLSKFDGALCKVTDNRK